VWQGASDKLKAVLAAHAYFQLAPCDSLLRPVFEMQLYCVILEMYRWVNGGKNVTEILCLSRSFLSVLKDNDVAVRHAQH
jgi:hypothetical protein